MMKHALVILSIAMIPTCLYAVDGQVLINQATVIAAGGFPYSITQPGSYKLSGNLTVPTNHSGIEINADSVTIDLNGFSITGPGATATFGHGIFSQSHSNITIRNGTVQNMPGNGIDIIGGDSALIEYMHIRGNFGDGIVINGVSAPFDNLIMQHNTVQGNGFSGIEIAIPGGGGTVAFNVVSKNAEVGLSIENASAVNYIGNVFSGNPLAPVIGGVNQGQNLCDSVACPGAVL